MENLINNFLTRNGLKLHTTHFKSHLEEMGQEALSAALLKWEEMGAPVGDISIPVDGFQGKTRLWGEKMGDSISMEEENFFYKTRGEGRPPQRLICRENPFKNTNIITIAVYVKEGVKGLETIYAGPSMPAFEDDPNGEWDRNFLAFPSSFFQEK